MRVRWRHRDRPPASRATRRYSRGGTKAAEKRRPLRLSATPQRLGSDGTMRPSCPKRSRRRIRSPPAHSSQTLLCADFRVPAAQQSLALVGRAELGEVVVDQLDVSKLWRDV